MVYKVIMQCHYNFVNYVRITHHCFFSQPFFIKNPILKPITFYPVFNEFANSHIQVERAINCVYLSIQFVYITVVQTKIKSFI